MANESAYWVREGADRFRPTEHVGGAWQPGEIHFSPLGGLIVQAMEAHRSAAHDDKVLARVSFDILGFLAAEPCDVTVTTTRPGRTIELVEATVTIAGRAAVSARAWYLSESDTADVAGGAASALPSPEGLGSWRMSDVWSGGYIRSLDLRPVRPPKPGRATVWIRSTTTGLIQDEPASAIATFVSLVDTANGIAVRHHPHEWVFPNVDLTIHFFRQPDPAWVGLDTEVVFGPNGIGLTSTTLHDVRGAVGRAEQSLTLRRQQPRPDQASGTS
jgi:hypothetical protein